MIKCPLRFFRRRTLFQTQVHSGARAVFSSWGSRGIRLTCPYKPVTGGWILTGDREQGPAFPPQGGKGVGGREDYKPHLDGVIRRRGEADSCQQQMQMLVASRRAVPSVSAQWGLGDGLPGPGRMPFRSLTVKPMPFLPWEFRKQVTKSSMITLSLVKTEQVLNIIILTSQG